MSDTESLPGDGQIDEMVQSLADWLSKQPHLPRIQDDKELLRKFLTNCKCRVEKTKAKIDKYYSARTAHSEVYKNRDPTANSIQTISKLITFIPLPKRTKKGELAMIARVNGNPREIITTDFLRYFSMVLDLIFLEEEERLKFIIIMDYRGYSFRHFLRLAPIATISMQLLMEVFPGEFKSSHSVNVPSFINIIMTLLKNLVQAKFRDRFHVHKDLVTLYDVIERDLLPIDFCGNLLSLEELNSKLNSVHFTDMQALFSQLDDQFKRLNGKNTMFFFSPR